MIEDPPGRDRDAFLALTRFGLGPRPGDLRRVAADPRGAVSAELAKRDVALLPDPYLKSTPDYVREALEKRTLRFVSTGRKLNGQQRAVVELMGRDGRLTPEQVRASLDAEETGAKPKRAKDRDMADMADRDMPDRDMDMDDESDERASKSAAKPRKAELPESASSPLPDEAAARFARARKCDIGFAERLVQFWTNHFTVSWRGVAYLNWVAGAYEREAIRPHALGRFADLAMAATRHPAMLRYLNNDASVGPNSRIGERRGKGLNENHARELMELHTLGVQGGYSQADVIALAKAMTGWRYGKRPGDDAYGRFLFAPQAHEPGDQTILGKVYRDGGVEQASAAIRDLCARPATASHVARRLASAFVSDAPPQALVDRLAKRFRDTEGDLREVSLALVSSDEAWAAPRSKMRSPQEFLFGCARAVTAAPEPEDMTAGLAALGQPLWGAPSPKGYSLAGADWLSPDAQTNRLDFAVDLSAVHAPGIDPNALAADLLGDVMSDETKTAVKRAGSREQAMALLLMSPEIQRR